MAVNLTKQVSWYCRLSKAAARSPACGLPAFHPPPFFIISVFWSRHEAPVKHSGLPNKCSSVPALLRAAYSDKFTELRGVAKLQPKYFCVCAVCDWNVAYIKFSTDELLCKVSHQLGRARADRKAFICMCRSSPRAGKEGIYSLSPYNPLWLCKIFPSGYKLQTLHLQMHLSPVCPLHLFLPLLSFLPLSQVILPFLFLSSSRWISPCFTSYSVFLCVVCLKFFPSAFVLLLLFCVNAALTLVCLFFICPYDFFKYILQLLMDALLFQPFIHKNKYSSLRRWGLTCFF